MARNGRLVYPEIECWPAVGTLSEKLIESTVNESKHSFDIDIDILEVVDSVVDSAAISTKCNNFDAVLKHFKDTTHPGSKEVMLRIFFIEHWNLSPDWMDSGSSNIAKWMMEAFGVSPLFFRSIIQEVKFRHDGGTSFPTRDLEGKVTSIDGFYQISAGIRTPVSYMWFKHALPECAMSTYICYKCPEAAKQKIKSLVAGQPASLLRPLSVDALVIAERLNFWGEALQKDHASLRDYITELETSQSPELRTKMVTSLRNLAEHFLIIRTVLEDIHEHVEYLIRIHQIPSYSQILQPQLGGEDYGAVRESLLYLLSQTKTMTRWVISYVDHTGIVMDHLFNLFTSSIAVSTQQDSSSMITMAAVTMFFLPGTFVSALFSMVFFNANESNTGLSVNSQLWLFFVVTVPLTVGVFAIWELWRRRRQHQQVALRGNRERPTTGDGAQMVNIDGDPQTYGLAFRQSPLSGSSNISRSRSGRSFVGSVDSSAHRTGRRK